MNLGTYEQVINYLSDRKCSESLEMLIKPLVGNSLQTRYDVRYIVLATSGSSDRIRFDSFPIADGFSGLLF
jgi:hypothetical protein